MDYDVIIAGAGPAGCLVARDLARAGLRVGLFDPGTRDRPGKPIIIEAEKSIFDRVGVKAPEGDDVPYHHDRIRVFSRRHVEAFRVDGPTPAMAMYLDRFVGQLLDEAIDAGADFHEKHMATAPISKNKTVTGVAFDNGGRSQEVSARLTIDATGFSAALVGKLDPEMGIDFAPHPNDEVIAENRFHRLDVEKAREAVSKGLAADEEIWTRLGFAGPYSTEFGHMSIKQRTAYILVGFKADRGYPSIGECIDDYRDRMGFFGEPLHGGRAPIRIAHSLDKLVANGFMVVGEAACMVIPILGSGVASALWAGHLAAKTAAPVLKHGEPTTGALWRYSYEYQRGRGGTLAALDVSRLTVDHFGEPEVERLMESGIMTAEDMVNSMVPVAVNMSSASLPGRIAGMAKNPKFIPPVARMGIATMRVLNHYKKYPKQYDRYEFGKWKTLKRNAFGRLLDR